MVNLRSMRIVPRSWASLLRCPVRSSDTESAGVPTPPTDFYGNRGISLGDTGVPLKLPASQLIFASIRTLSRAARPLPVANGVAPLVN